MDALLFAARDAVRGGGFGYDQKTCDITPDGQPPSGAGKVFAAVHQGGVSNRALNSLDEYYDFNLTLTMRLDGIPPDRVGDRLLARKVASETGFNGRAHALKLFLHMNWGVLQDANNNLVEMAGDAPLVYGFAEPAHFAGADEPQLVGGPWFWADPESSEVGLKSTLRFADCRRLQPIGSYT